jgi:photosystem II stability/assembly factor-like uncharacterized protein
MQSSLLTGALVALLFAASAVAAQTVPFADVLETPAALSAHLDKSELMALRPAGDHLVAAGPRGRIFVSDQRGENWKQAVTPVSTDLVALCFPTAAQGWAVGHDGVILHSADGGLTWTKQLDGRQARVLMLAHYARLEQAGAPGAAKILAEVKAFPADVAATPLLDVWFRNAQEGFVVGAFNMIFRTTDGGQHWEPWYERTANPRRLHLNAIQAGGDAVYVAGEQGLLLKLDPSAARFDGLVSPYAGSWFGVLSDGRQVLLFGLRGNAWRSADGGKEWKKLVTGTRQLLVAGAVLPGRRYVLAADDGQLLVGSFDDDRLSPFVAAHRPRRIYAMVPHGGTRLALAGDAGLTLSPLP